MWKILRKELHINKAGSGCVYRGPAHSSTSGLYKIARHPSYLGLMLIIARFGLSEGSILSFIVVIVPVFIAMNYRMIVEEKALLNEFGTQYEDYKKRVSRIVPFIY